jgi:saccharopine dehydrogenase-like NADP-dependent oxidoreductase
MAARVLVIGGYGNFGSHIALSLALDPQIRLLIGGRAEAKAKAKAFAARLGGANPAEGHAIDIDGDLAAALDRTSPDIVVHTTGPFQRQDHRVARAVIISTLRTLATSSSRSASSTPQRACAGLSW